MSMEQSTALIQMSKGRRNIIQFGAICLVVSVACYGLALSTLISPVLEHHDAMEYVSLLSVLGSIGITIMTPIGGKLGDIFGRKAIVVIAGILCAVFGVGIAYAPNLIVLFICRVGVGLAQGAFMAAPYIIVGVINDKKDVPKAMGLLAMALSVGGFAGSIIAGILTDLDMLNAAILFPVIPLIIGVVLIGVYYPNDKNDNKVNIDVGGIVLLTIALSGILFPLNFGTSVGWTNPIIIGGFILGILFTIFLILWERRAQYPIIPVKMFMHKEYVAFVIISFLCYFYRGAMDVYSPLGAIQVMKASTATAGSLQFPRTIITMFLPILTGAWVARNRENIWKAMAITTATIAFPMLVMGFASPESSILLYFIPLAITGISESYRGVSITPGAQACVKPEDIGVGTALINFANSLSSSLAAAIYGVAYNTFTVADPTNIENVTRGVNSVFLLAGGVSMIGFVLVLVWVRPLIKRQSLGI